LSLLKRPRQACCATPVQNQKRWKTAAFALFQFFDPTTEVAERLRIILAMEQSEVPSGLKSQIDRLREMEEQSPSIVPLMRNGDL
jgi:hypothetical protein